MCPRLFTIGSFSLPTYGLLVAAGFLVGLYLLGKLSQRQGLDPEKMGNLGVYVALAAIAGAKIFMTFADLDVYLEDPSRLFSSSWLQAGGTFYGGLLAALATAFWYCRKEGIGGLEAADTFAPAAAIGEVYRVTLTQPPLVTDRSDASSTACTATPSSKSGLNFCLPATARTKSATWCTNVCS